MARGLLADAGIPSAIVADDAGGAYAGIAPARLLVSPEHAPRAREVLETIESDEAGPG